MNMDMGNFEGQSRVASESGDVGPSIGPSGHDKRVVLLAGIGVVITAAVIILVNVL